MEDDMTIQKAEKIKYVTALISAILILLISLPAAIHTAVINKSPIYDPGLDAKKAITEMVAAAKIEKENVLVMFGANWCPWCHRLHELLNTDNEIQKIIKDNYMMILVDIGEKKDQPLNRDLVNDFRVNGFGYPALAVINSQDGSLLVAQSTGILEKGKGYDIEKVLGFLKAQSPN